MNCIYCKGVPTYEIANKKRSIIDMCFTNAPQSICSFSVDPKPLGVNSQTCHKLIMAVIRTCPFERVSKTVHRRLTFGPVTKEDQVKITHCATDRISALCRSGSSSDYFQLRKVYSRVKRQILDRERKCVTKLL